VSDAGCGSGTLRLRRTIPLLFREKSLKTACFDSFILTRLSQLDAEMGYFSEKIGRRGA
jgi:hypothetical protein